MFARLSPGKYLVGIYNDRSAIFDAATEKVTYFNVTAQDYPEEQTRYAGNDRQGNTWVLQRGFLYMTIPRQYRLETVKTPNLTSVSWKKPILKGIYFDSSQQLFYGAVYASVGVHVFDNNFNPVKVIPSQVINNYFSYMGTVDHKITKDGAGRFWTASWRCSVLKPGSNRFENLENVFPSLNWLTAEGEAHDIATTSNGDILYKMPNGSVYWINYQTGMVDTIRVPAMKNEGVQIKPATTWNDRKRNLIYLTGDEGIAQYNLSQKQARIIPYTSLFGQHPHKQGVSVS
jgi:hypothetical protein